MLGKKREFDEMMIGDMGGPPPLPPQNLNAPVRPTEPMPQMNAFIGKGCEFVGKLTFEGTVRINGKVEGEIFSRGTLIIGSEAFIEATINVDSVIVEGHVSGNVNASKRIDLRSPARLYGDIRTPNLTIQEGVIFEGNCKMENQDVKAKEPVIREPIKPVKAEASMGQEIFQSGQKPKPML